MKIHPNVMVAAFLALLFSQNQLVRAAESIHPETVLPGDRAMDAPNWELGTIFRPKVSGKVTSVRVFSLQEESGEHPVRIWRNADNTLVAGPIAWAFGGDEAWIALDIPDLTVQGGQDYTISISTTPEGWYPINSGYFATAGNNGQFLDFPQAAGVFSETAGVRPTSSFGNASYLRDIVFEPDISGTIMQVSWNGVEIADGSTNSSAPNGTDLGGKGLNAGTRDVTYTISNLGQSTLQLSGTPLVSISGSQASDFVVITQPATTVPGGGSTTFTIRFDPSAIGVRDATVSIAHADSAGNPFDFTVRGRGLGGGAGVLGNDSDGAFARNIDATQIVGNRFQAPVAMRITELRAKVLDLTGIFKCAVYSDTNGAADRLLKGSVEVVNATNGWNSFPLTAPLDLVAGDWYWLVIWADTPGARVQADPVGQGYFGIYSYNDLAGEWPDPISLAPLTGDAASRTYCIYSEGAPIGIGPGAELDLRGNGKLIVSGDSTPSALDGTQFGSRNLGDALDRTFTIENRGDAPLNLTGNAPVSIAGSEAGDWTVTSPPTTPVAPGGSTQFTLRFSPAASGLRSATVSIANGDPDENPYRFAVQGAGLATGRETIFPDTKIGRDIDFDGTYYELGTVFKASVPGRITHLRVFSLASESGDHTARLWRNDDGTGVDKVIGGPYTWNYGGVTGWITLDIPDVDIEAGVDYTVSVSTGTSARRNYPNIAADLLTAGGNGQHLTYPVNAGVFEDIGRDARPTKSFNGGNYLRDVIFVPAGPESIFPDTKIGRDIDFDGTYYELGTVFQSSVAGKITHLRVFSLASESGDHTARLWRNDDGTGVDKVIGGPYTWNYGGVTGWITLDIPDVDIEAGVDYTVSVSTGTSARRNYPNIAADLLTAGGNAQHLSYPVNAGVFEDIGRDARPTKSFNGGNYLRDVIFLRAGAAAPSAPLNILEVSRDLTAGSITFWWQGDGPQFQVEKATEVTGPYQPVGSPQSAQVFTDSIASQSGARAFYRVRRVP